MNYLTEAGALYRHLKEDEQPIHGELLMRYRAFHHPTGTVIDRRIVMVNYRRSDWLELLNHWNRQPSSGWSYHSIEG